MAENATTRRRRDPGQRAEARRRREITRQIKALRAERAAVYHVIPWGLPWCTGPGSPYCHGPACEGCACTEVYRGDLDEYTRQIKALDEQIKALTAPTAVEGELLSLVNGQWVLADAH